MTVFVSTRISNKARQLFYRPRRSKFLPGDIKKIIKNIDKDIGGGINTLLGEIGLETEKEKKDDKDDKGGKEG